MGSEPFNSSFNKYCGGLASPELLNALSQFCAEGREVRIVVDDQINTLMTARPALAPECGPYIFCFVTTRAQVRAVLP